MDFDGFDWDEGNLEKCCKHGVTVAQIEHVLSNPDFVSEDRLHSIAEQRFIAVGDALDRRTMFVAFTLRETDGTTLLRPISARYMHDKEKRRYVEKTRD